MKMRLMLVLILAVALTGCSGLFGGGGGGDDTNSASLSESCAADATLDECVAACDKDSSLEWCDDDEVDCDANPLAEGCEGEDQDDDGIADADDNCIDLENAGQEDADGDGVGDACEENTSPALSILADDGAAFTKKIYDDVQIDTTVTRTFTVSGATGPVTWSVEGLDGATFEQTADGANMTISYTPTVSGSFTATIAADDDEALSKADVTFTVHEPEIGVVMTLEKADGAKLSIPAFKLQDTLTIQKGDRLVLMVPNRSEDYDFGTDNSAYKVTARACKENDDFCSAVITPKHSDDTVLPAATFTVTNEVDDTGAVELKGGVEIETITLLPIDDSFQAPAHLNRTIDVGAVEETTSCKLGKLADAKEIVVYPLFKDNGQYDDDAKMGFDLLAGEDVAGGTGLWTVDGNDNGIINDLSPIKDAVIPAEMGDTCLEDIDAVRLRYTNTWYMTKCDDYSRSTCAAWRYPDIHAKRVLVKAVITTDSGKTKTYYAHIANGDDLGQSDYDNKTGSWDQDLDSCDAVGADAAFNGEEDDFGRNTVVWCKTISDKKDDGKLMFDWEEWPK